MEHRGSKVMSGDDMIVSPDGWVWRVSRESTRMKQSRDKVAEFDLTLFIM